jgi:L-ascorbate oxidase
VQARAPTLGDPTFGDYIFVEIYNSANGTPVPQATHQHGSLVKDYADYRIDIPANHPSGAFWFHPHVHGIALNQVSSGLSGIISIGKAGDYAKGDQQKLPFRDASVRHLVLKDLQVLAGGNIMFDNGPADVADGEVLNQQDPDFCAQFPGAGEERQGSCPGVNNSPDGNNYVGDTWFFTVSGQQFPTMRITEPDGEIWRLTNASGSLSYDLQLINDATQAPMVMQLISVDGVSIDVPRHPTRGGALQDRSLPARHGQRPQLRLGLHHRIRDDAEFAGGDLCNLSRCERPHRYATVRRHRHVQADWHHHRRGRRFLAGGRSR